MLTPIALLSILFLPTLVPAFPTGAGLCQVDPAAIAAAANGAMGQQNERLGFTLSTPAGVTTYAANQPVTVSVGGGGEYKGLLIYAANEVGAETHLGTWTVQPGFRVWRPADSWLRKHLEGADAPADCTPFGPGSTLSHDSPDAKVLPANFTWTPPAAAAGNVQFFAVVVVDTDTGFQSLTTAQALTPAA
ncbi:uncharacterized protein EV422DRAFT_507488 [Fimicolochytrium jonesii]|uniref:uncharacterized protein n=1 Tax=Fimicolochytrium jonesii TaxID=1396493 RepID=UPI0022FF13C4|nr:uncharacterized protein EV422DRAFT_507488 [Fimicolochytrium jonesii]KAI8819423.1 hypothetical protein EV422DRAFT_507488 [Fimicolochytrium jonesii]